MVHVNTVLESLVTVCQQSDELPRAVTYSTVQLDEEGQHSNVSPPVIEFSVDQLDRDLSRNTERVGWIADADDNKIGYWFTAWYTATITADVLTVAGTRYTHRDLNRALERALLPYDNHYRELDRELPDPESPSEPLENVSGVRLPGTQPNHDFSVSPSIRRRRQDIEVMFEDDINSVDLVGPEPTLTDQDTTADVED